MKIYFVSLSQIGLNISKKYFYIWSQLRVKVKESYAKIIYAYNSGPRHIVENHNIGCILEKSLKN